ncbi:MAG: hypothetical protein JNN20_14725 [Betaproteobacteria bacterium]|nr:hypothetical protein [Betaproteobacteria bacterium]
MLLSPRSCVAALALAASSLQVLAAPPSIGGCQILPANNYWNTPVDTLPVHPSSAAWIASIGGAQGVNRGLHADWGNNPNAGGVNEIVEYGIPYITVGSPLPSSSVSFLYDDESDPGPYPIPTTAPVEGGPSSNGDRHVLAIDTVNCVLYELYRAFPAGANAWTADSGARFPLNSNASRPNGWTSADASGLAILPGLVKWEEVAAGEINHAIRFTAPNIWGLEGTTRKYLWPARHWSGSGTNPNNPPMGTRVRLKASFNISGFDSRTQVILRAFKKYGMVLVDGGSSWYFQGMSNVNWPSVVISQLNNSSLIKGGDFEVVDTLPLQINPNSEQSVQPPSAPNNFAAAPGNGQVTFSFTPPADNGGKAILDYTVTCNPGSLTATAAASPITLSVTNGVALGCSMTARNVVFSGTPTNVVNVTAGLPMISVSPSSINYGDVIDGDIVSAQLTIRNTGSGNLQLQSFTLTGNTSEFAPLFNTPNNCAIPSTLAAGALCNVEIQFWSLGGGGGGVAALYTANLGITHNAGATITVPLQANSIVPPSPPLTVSAVAGNGQAAILFSPPAASGGTAITGYTASCTPGPVVASGTISPIVVSGLGNGTTYNCTVAATNAAGTSFPSASASVTPNATPALGLLGVQSRKLHTGVQDFDLPIQTPVAIDGAITVEPRSIGAGHRIVFQFNGAISDAGTVTAVDSASAPIGNATASFQGNEVTVTLTGVPDNKRVRVNLSNVNNAGVTAEASIGFLVGDVNGTGRVNASDISAIKTRVGQAASMTHFRFDLNTSGNVTLLDASAAKARSGTVLLP